MIEFGSLVTNEDNLGWNITSCVLFQSRPVVLPSGSASEGRAPALGGCKAHSKHIRWRRDTLDEELLLRTYWVLNASDTRSLWKGSGFRMCLCIAEVSCFVTVLSKATNPPPPAQPPLQAGCWAECCEVAITHYTGGHITQRDLWWKM